MIFKLNYKEWFTSDRAIYWCSLLVFYQYLIILTIGYVLNRVGLRDEIYSRIAYYLFFSFFLFKHIGNYKLEKKSFIFYVVLLVFLGISYLYSWLVSPQIFSYEILGFNQVQFFVFLPIVATIFMSIKDFVCLSEFLTKGARVLSLVVIFNLLLQYSRGNNSFGLMQYDMEMGYYAILCAIVLISSYLRDRKLYDLFVSLLLVGFDMLFGSRGSLVVAFVFILLVVIKKYFLHRPISQRVLFVLASCILLYLFFNYYLDVLKQLLKIADAFNINSRTLSYLIENNFAYQSNRDIFQANVTSNWGDMPVLGYGILGDRQFNNGAYCHNILIEMITDYGFFIAGLLFIMFAARIIKSFFKEDTDVAIIILAFTGVQLLVSGSYLSTVYFFIYIGILFNAHLNERESYEN